MLIGYGRVSTDDQDLQLQLDALEDAGCERIFTDKASGKGQKRDGLDKALDQLRAGDVFVVWKLDRLGRTVKGLIEFTETLGEQGIEFRSITDGIDTTTPAGRFFFHVMAALAQMERELIGERTRAGLQAARQRGRIGGRPRKMTPAKLDVAKTLIESGMAKKDIAEHLGVSRSALYHWLSKAA